MSTVRFLYFQITVIRACGTYPIFNIRETVSQKPGSRSFSLFAHTIGNLNTIFPLPLGDFLSRQKQEGKAVTMAMKEI